MYKQLLLVAIFISSSVDLFSQANCSSPTSVTICPDVYLSNQTNLNMLDDAPAASNVVGEDVVYQINVPITTNSLYVTVVNATGPYRLSLILNNCSNSPTYSSNIPVGSQNFYFTYVNTSTYFIWIDAASSITFDLAIGADTLTVPVNIPNTMGNLGFDMSGCASPFFNPTKPYYQVHYNGIAQTEPMTLAPLFTQGTMCITTFFKNLTGVEAISQFQFDFNVNGYASLQCPDSIPGRYTPGYWIKTAAGNIITYNFTDSLRTGKGDFSGSPNSCLEYRFCFDLIPLSNSPLYTSIDVLMKSDNKGAPYSGTMKYGCCPSTIPNCHGSSGGGGGGGGTTFAFGVDDPGTTLPIELLNFNLKQIANKISINWSTASEINNDYFSIERSKNIVDWTTIELVQGAGNSTTVRNYEIIDEAPNPGINYYRLKQTDFDGKFTYSSIESILNKTDDVFRIYPNPAINQFTIENENIGSYEIYLYSNLGNKTSVSFSKDTGKVSVFTSDLEPGIYFLFIYQNNQMIKKEIISITK